MKQTFKLKQFKVFGYGALKLFVAGLLLLIGVLAGKQLVLTAMIMAGIWMMLPFKAVFQKRLDRLCEGDGGADDDDDEKKKLDQVLKTIRVRTEKLLEKRGFVDKAALKKELDTRMAAFVGLKKEEVEEWKKLLSTDEKNPEAIRSILKKQGETLLAMQEAGKKADKQLGHLRSMLKDKMKDIKKIFEEGQGEIRLNTRAAVVMTTGNTIDENEADLPDDILESFSIGSFVPKRQAREYVFDLARRTTSADLPKYKTWLEEGDVEGGFAIVAEGGLKPLISGALVRNYVGISKIAAKRVYTEEFAKFRKEAYNIIERMIQQQLIRDYAALLTTDLLADAAPYVASALDGQYPNPTDYHAIGAVAAQIEALEFFPDMLIMNPQDKWRIGLLQDNQGQFYLTIPVVSPTGQTQMMGFTVRTSTKVPVGSFLLGESGLWEIEDETITIRMGLGVTVTGGASNGGGDVTDVQADFDHNRFRILAEMYFRSFISSQNVGSFVLAEFDVVKTALTTI